MPVAAITLLAIGLWQWSFVSILFALILNRLMEIYPLHISGNRIKGAGEIRILTYNVNRAHKGSINKGSTSGLIRFILRQEPDIILLQEYNAELYPEVREKLLQSYLYEVGTNEGGRFKSVFSKFPIVDYKQLSVKAVDSDYELFQHAWYCKSRVGQLEILPMCSMIAKVGETKIRIVNCHLMSNNYSVVIRIIKNKGKSFLRAILPIIARMDYGYAVRKLQADIVCRHLCSCKEEAIIVCGDFNDISGSSTLRPFRKLGMKDTWWENGCGFGFTFHGMNLRLRLDHILYSRSKDLRLKGVYVPHSNASDHYPLIADFILSHN